MPVKSAPYNIQQVHAIRTAQALRELADRAERGEIVGAVVGYVVTDRSLRASLSGVCDRDRALAYLVAGKLSSALLEET